MKPANLLLAFEDPLLRENITYLLSTSQNSTQISEENPGDWKQVLQRMNQEHSDVLLVELNGLRTDLSNAFRAVKKAAAQTKIIVLHPTDDPQTIIAALRAGANEFVHPPYEETFAPALERVIESRNDEHTPERRGKVIGFLSAKSGCGATTLACHAAADLRRQTGKSVLLADLDLTSGMIGFIMKVASTYSILDAVANLSRLDESLWKALLS